MKRLSYAMIGGAEGSFIGPIHRAAVRMDNLADLVAGAFSRDPKRNARSGAALGLDPARVYDDAYALLASEKGRVDFVTICTTNDTHFALAKAALEAGYDVFCEKPLSLTVDEAVKLGQVAARQRRLLGVPFTYTGSPMVKLARDLVRKGRIGDVVKIVFEYQQGSFRKPDRRNTWKMDPKIAGPSCVLADIGVHAFTLIEYVTGCEVREVLSDISSYANTAGLDDDASVLMRLAGDAKASLVTSKIATGEENGVRFRIYGTKASLHWNQEEPNTLVQKFPLAPDRVYRRNAPYVGGLSAAAVRASRFPAGHPEGFVEAFANIYAEFTAAVRTRKACDYPSVREGIRAMRFVESCLKSAKDNSAWTKL